MTKLMDRIVDAVDSRADRYIRAIENILFALVFFLMFAFFLHLAAIAISEGGDRVTFQGHQAINKTGEMHNGN